MAEVRILDYSVYNIHFLGRLQLRYVRLQYRNSHSLPTNTTTTTTTTTSTTTTTTATTTTNNNALVSVYMVFKLL